MDHLGFNAGRDDFGSRNLFWAGIAIMLIGSTTIAQEVRETEIAAYKGWERNLRLTNEKVELIVTLEAGPRILSYRLLEGSNVFNEYPEQLGKSGEQGWQIRGGHRLWVSPEDPARTYVADNGPVHHEILGPGRVRVWLDPDPKFGLGKEISIELEQEGTRVKVTHKVTNASKGPAELAIWSLSVMRPGGVEVIPLPDKAPHPGGSANATAEMFAPAFPLVSWSYTDLTDPRYTIGADAIVLRQDATMPATKIGLTSRPGVAGYLNDGVLFVKHFPHLKGHTYPDFGSNYETYTDQGMLEMESLGPLVTLEPGKSIEHVETWKLLEGVSAPSDPTELIKTLRPILLSE